MCRENKRYEFNPIKLPSILMLHHIIKTYIHYTVYFVNIASGLATWRIVPPLPTTKNWQLLVIIAYSITQWINYLKAMLPKSISIHMRKFCQPAATVPASRKSPDARCILVIIPKGPRIARATPKKIKACIIHEHFNTEHESMLHCL